MQNLFLLFYSEPILAFGEHQLLSKGFQQGDPLSAMEFYEAVQPLLSRCESDVEIGFIDDFTLSGQLDNVASDVEMIAKSAEDICFVLTRQNVISSALMTNQPIWRSLNITSEWRPEDMALLDAFILKGPAIDKELFIKVDDLTRAVSSLTELQAHDGITLLRNCFSMPKLLYILRTSPCSGNHLLKKFDMALREVLTKILNIDLDDIQWTQANLPVNASGLGIKRAVKLAPSAILTSAASTLSLQNLILPSRTASIPDIDVRDASSTWTIFAEVPESPDEVRHIGKVWNRPVISNQLAEISPQLSSEVDKARILSASPPHSGDWLMAPPITSIGLRISDEMMNE